MRARNRFGAKQRRAERRWLMFKLGIPPRYKRRLVARGDILQRTSFRVQEPEQEVIYKLVLTTVPRDYNIRENWITAIAGAFDKTETEIAGIFQAVDLRQEVILVSGSSQAVLAAKRSGLGYFIREAIKIRTVRV